MKDIALIGWDRSKNLHVQSADDCYDLCQNYDAYSWQQHFTYDNHICWCYSGKPKRKRHNGYISGNWSNHLVKNKCLLSSPVQVKLLFMYAETVTETRKIESIIVFLLIT